MDNDVSKAFRVTDEHTVETSEQEVDDPRAKERAQRLAHATEVANLPHDNFDST